MKNSLPIVLIIASIWLFFGFVNPHFESVKSLRLEKAQYEEALQKAKEIEQVRSALVATYNSITTEQLASLGKLLPDSIDTVRLVIDTNRIAQEAGMTVHNINVETPKDIGGAAAQGASLGSAPGFNTLTMKFTVNGTYDSFIQFLHDLEKSLRVVDVSSIVIKSGKGNLFDFELEIRTYWLK